MLQVKHAKVLFRGLNSLLKRVDYLKSSIFGEDKDKDDDTVEDREED